MFDMLKEKIKGKGVRIVFTEGSDPRILEAAIRLHKENIIVPVLLGNRAEIEGCAAAKGWSTEGLELLDPKEYKNMDLMVTKVIELRKGKMDEETARLACLKTNFFGTMYVKLGCADGLLGGATYSTADTVRPALQLVKTKPGNSIVSSCFILMKDHEQLVMGDCSININPTADDLVEITLQTANTVRQFGIEPKVGLLSYSTLGSAKGESVTKVVEAATRLKRMPLDFEVEGEIQFDCCIAPEVATLKAPDSKVAGKINTFIFPNIDSGNIGYKIASRLGGYEAIGPILQGLNSPINDLSRGCNANEVYKMALVTAAQKFMDI
ncbi:MAG: phosphate acetyltransferase [Longicatena sp.]